MSKTNSPWERASAARTDWQRADGALNRLRSVHAELSSLHDAVTRNVPTMDDVAYATAAVDRLGDADPVAVSFVAEPVMPENQTLADAFHSGRAVTTAASDVATTLTGFAEGDRAGPLTSAVAAVVDPADGPMAIDTTALGEVVTLFGLAVEAGVRYREARENALQSALSEAYDDLDEPLPDLADQPMALLPVRMETRFVDVDGGTDGDPVELLIRVYPDQIHTDSHEAELTEEEVIWGQNFWATLWYARHPDPDVVPDDPTDSYLFKRLPNERLCEHVAGIDPAAFSDDHHARYGELRDRAWQQLLDRFGRERAAYVVHALEPTDDDLAADLRSRPRTLQSMLRRVTDGGENDPLDDVEVANDDDSTTFAGSEDVVASEDIDITGVLGGEGSDDATLKEIAEGAGVGPEIHDPSEDLPEEVPGIGFPDVPRRPGAWTKQPRAKLLPDRWIAVAEWETPSGTTKRTAIAGDPVCEPLPTGPSPESVAGEELDDGSGGNTTADGDRSDVAPDGAEWMTNFTEAKEAGMALRLPTNTLAGFDASRGFDRVSVVGVKGSLDDQSSADALEALLDAHHYTDGLEVLPQGTPTNNHEGTAGTDDGDLPGADVECETALVEDGDLSDGDLLARALSIDPGEGEDHVFAHVANADGTEQRDARQMNSALWPATLGYSLANVFVDNEIAGIPSNGGAKAANGAAGAAGVGAGGLSLGPTRDTVEGHLLWLDAYRRHFIRYVRGRGPFPTLRVGDQPYGVLPATAVDTDYDLSLIDSTLIADLGKPTVDFEQVASQGGTVDSLVNGGVEPKLLIESGAPADEVLAAGADPKRLVSGGVDPEQVLDASGLAPEGLLQDGVGHLATSRLTKDRLRQAGVPVEKLDEAGVTTRSLARGEVSNAQLAELGVMTDTIAEVVLPEQAKTLGLTPAALERAGVTPATLLNGEFSTEQVEHLGLDARAVADAILPDAARELGITPKPIEDAGIKPTDLLNGKVSVEELEAAGVTTEALADTLLPQAVKNFGVTPDVIASADVSVADLFNSDVSIDQLEAAGLNTANFADAVLPQSFRDAGITPRSLEDAGITPDAVLNGTVTPDATLEAGITPSALADVGQTIGDLLESGLDPGVLFDRRLTPQSLMDAGVTPDLLIEAGLAPKHLVEAGVDTVELAAKNAASIEDLLSAGASPSDLARAGATVADFAGGDVPVQELVQTGMTALDLVSDGADALGAAEGGARPSHLREANVAAGTLREAGRAAGSLRVAGYTAEEALEVGYTASELLNGGYSPEELTAASVSSKKAQDGGRDVSTMLAAGHVPEELKAAGYAAEQLLEGGLEPTDLVTAGYTAGELADAGLETQDLVESGLDVGSLRAADLDVQSLLDAGVDLETLRERGATAQELIDAGTDPEKLLDAGFKSVELEVAGVEVGALARDAVEGDLSTDDLVDTAVEGLQYAATVLESPEQAETDAYSFSFDPAVPMLTNGQGTSGTGPGDGGGSRDGDGQTGETDGGVGTAGVPVVRPLSIDDRIGGRLRNEVSGLASLWEEAASGLSFGGDVDEDGLLDALKREAVSRDVRQATMVYVGETRSDLTDEIASAVERYFLPDHRRAVEAVFGDAELSNRDLRIESMYPTDATRDEAVVDVRNRDKNGGLRTFYTEHLSQGQQGIILPHETVDADIGLFIDVLLWSGVSDVHDLGDVVNPLTFNFDMDALELTNSEWYGMDAADQRRKILKAIEDADDPSQFTRELTNHDPTGHEQGYAKLLTLGDNQAEFNDTGVLSSLLRILLQHGLLNEYLAARRRLGAAYDDLPAPFVDPAVAPEDDPTMMDTLWDEAPDALRTHPDVDDTDEIYYQQSLTAAAANCGSTTSIDPRLSEFTDSLRYLAGLDPDTLSELTHETLDLASDRLDAWWTSIATKELFELREAQGTVDPDGGVDHERWDGADSDAMRATLDPALLSSIETTTLATGATMQTEETADSIAHASTTGASTRAFDPAALEGISLSPTSNNGDSASDGGVDQADVSTQESGEDVAAETTSQASESNNGSIDFGATSDTLDVAERGKVIDTSRIDDRAASEPGLYVGGYGFVENLSADREGTADPEYIHALSEQHASTAAILHSGADAHDEDEGENVLAMDLSARRVRAARRLLDGVRRGQSLGELLGYRIERRLHELTLDPDEPELMQYAGVFRAEFPQRLDKLTRPDETTTAAKDERRDDLAVRDALDGLAFLNGWVEYPWDRDETLPGSGSAAHDAIGRIVADLRDDIDAVGDLLTAESVHQLGQGNIERAGGSINALARGDPLPESDVVETPRTETGLTHRQFVLLGADAEPSDAAAEDGAVSPRSTAAPSLSAWAETLLPDHADVECTATYRWTEETTDEVTQNPTEVEHSEPTWTSLDALDLGPLDVLLLFDASREETRSELEQRIVYQLVRQRPSDPAVPADTRAELELSETHTEGAVSVADLLELARSVREVVQSARPATAADLTHPSDAAGEGYDASTAETLTARANDAHDGLYETALAIDERLAVLDASHDTGDGIAEIPMPATGETAGDGGTPPVTSWANLDGGVHLPPDAAPTLDRPFVPEGPTLTEQVDALVDAVERIDEEMPLSTVEAAAGGLDAGSLRSELAAFVADLPAGPTKRETATADQVVDATEDQSITGRLGDPVQIPDASEATDDDEQDGDGADADDDSDGADGGLSSGPTSWTPARQELEAGILGVAETEVATVSMDDAAETDTTDVAWYADAIETVDLDPSLLGMIDVDGDREDGSDKGESGAEAGERRGNGGETRPSGGVDWATTTGTVRAWGTDGIDVFERTATASPYSDGRFAVDLDFSGITPGTAFQVVALVDSTVVYSGSGRVVEGDAGTAGAQATFREDCPNLQALSWLRARQSLLVADDGPSGEFVSAHDGIESWAAITDERDAVDPADSTVTGDQLSAIDDLLALEGLDPGSVPDDLDAAVAPVAKLGLDQVVDVTAGESSDSPKDVSYWVGESPAMGSIRARIQRTLDDPGCYNAGVAPWLLKYDHGTAARLDGLTDGPTIAAYIDAFLGQPPWVIRYLDRKLSDPTALVRNLTVWLYRPDELGDTSELAVQLTDLASVIEDRPALASLFTGLDTGEASGLLAAFAGHLRTLAGELGGDPPSIGDPADAEAGFDADAATAADKLANAAGNEQTAVDPIVAGSSVPRAVRTVVLEQLREPMTVAASYGVHGGTPAEPDGDTPEAEAAMVEQARGLLERLRTRLEEAGPLDPRIDGTLAEQPVPQRVEAQTDRLATLFGEGFSVLPPFSPANPGELSATFGDGELVPDEHSLAPETWLQRSAAHRERVADFRESRSFSEAIGGELTPSLTIGQVPFEEGDIWVGIDGVDPTPGRVSLVAQFGPGASAGTAGDRLTGLCVDEWNETIPSATETTGLAVNYDDPGNRAPQSILLVPPPSDGWTLDHLAATVAEMSDYAKRRAVDLGDLSADTTHLFPALTFAQGGGTHRHTPSVNFGMLDWYDRKLVASLQPPTYTFVGTSGGGDDE